MKNSTKYIIFTSTFILSCCLALMFVIHSRNEEKTAIHIEIDDLTDEIYYVTILSSEESVADSKVYDGSNGTYTQDDQMYPIWEKFTQYEDEDGYFFLQEIVKCQGDTSFTWSDYIPESFKILLYFPEDDSYVVTSIRDDDMTDYYIIHMDEVKSDVPYIPVRRFHTGIIVFFLFIRTAGVIWVELSIAMLFKYRERKQLIFVGVLNGAAHAILNVYLLYAAYQYGVLALLAGLFTFGSIVFLIKTALYNICIPVLASETISRLKVFLYSVVSSVLSSVAVWVLAYLYAGVY